MNSPVHQVMQVEKLIEYVGDTDMSFDHVKCLRYLKRTSKNMIAFKIFCKADLWLEFSFREMNAGS